MSKPRIRLKNNYMQSALLPEPSNPLNDPLPESMSGEKMTNTEAVNDNVVTLKRRKILIGCDPELFVFNKQTHLPVSAHTLLPGTKASPMEITNGAIQVDGVAAEFNIIPADNEEDFLLRIKHVQRFMDTLIKRKNKDLYLSPTPTAHFVPEYFQSLPADVRVLGCQPDYNAYTLQPNPKPNGKVFFRTGSGHIHIGWREKEEHGRWDWESENYLEVCAELVRELDFVLYNSSKMWDFDIQRQELYGAMGSFRPKSYGLEYRVLSNAWLKSPKLQKFVFHASKAVTQSWLNGKLLSRNFNVHPLKFQQFCAYLHENKIPSLLDFTSEKELTPETQRMVG